MEVDVVARAKRMVEVSRKRESEKAATDAETLQQIRDREPQFSCWLEEIKKMDPASKLVYVECGETKIGRPFAQRIGAVAVRASEHLIPKPKRRA